MYLPLISLLLKLCVLGAAFASAFAAAPAPAQTLLGCENRCGNISMPYPFGTTEGCYIEQHFKVNCNHTYNPPKLFLEISNVEIIDIVLSGELSISFFTAQDCYNNQSLQAANTKPYITLPEFPISYTRNNLTRVGWDTIAVIQGSNEGNNTAGCLSLCDSINNVTNGSCSGFGCCHTFIPKGMKSLSIRVSSHDRHTHVSDFNPCSYAFVAEETAYSFSSLDLKDLQGRTKVPVVLDWAVGNQRCDQAKKNLSTYACKDDNSDCVDFDNGPGYRCKCSKGYEGNPYIPNGCLGNHNLYLLKVFIFFLNIDTMIYSMDNE
ncbi:Wall-associated receptor kinase 2 [Camellia lanceoleosa]|uniref:Wall-associated receptor kinase 2 n=1 Tax=Camellia lanceoleosa TaxID=1840588 RepID=A0ACC0HLX2_9ERIC|nr:Wall-associated receptor kinase 2 [Camellia lanceoleosa]